MTEMKKKYTEWRINIIDIEAREEFGDWESVARWQGKSIIAAKKSTGLLKKLKSWIENVVDPDGLNKSPTQKEES